MKTSIFNISLAVLITTSSFMLGRMDANQEIPATQEKQEMTLDGQTSNDNVYTRAIIVDGEMIAVVDLPELIISADKPKQYILHATIQNGEVLPYVNLPEVKIEA